MAFRPEETVSISSLETYSQKESQYSYPTNPLGEASPEEDTLGQLVKTAKNRDSGSGKTTHGFKHSIQIVGIKRYYKWDRSDQRKNNPSQTADQHRLDTV